MLMLYNVLWECNGVLLSNLNLFHISMVEWVYYVVRMIIADGLVLWCQGICCHHPELYWYGWFLWLPGSWASAGILSCCYCYWLSEWLVSEVILAGYNKFIIWHFYPHEIIAIMTLWSNTSYLLVLLFFIYGSMVERKFRRFQISGVVYFEQRAYYPAELGDTYGKLQPNWGGQSYNECCMLYCIVFIMCDFFIHTMCPNRYIFIIIFFCSVHWLNFPTLGDYWLCWVPVAAPVIYCPWLCGWLSCLWLHCAHQSLSCWSSCGLWLLVSIWLPVTVLST